MIVEKKYLILTLICKMGWASALLWLREDVELGKTWSGPYLWWIINQNQGNGTPLQYSCLENPMDRGAWLGCSPWGRWESDTTAQLHFHFSLSCIGEGTGNPLQCSCLENPRDGGAWWAAVHWVAQSRTWLKRLSSSIQCHYACILS